MNKYWPLLLAVPLFYDDIKYYVNYSSVRRNIRVVRLDSEIEIMALDVSDDNLYVLLDVLRTLPLGSHIKLFLRTYGGSATACFLICDFIKENRKHGGQVSVYVKDYSLSSGTIICLCADNFYFTDSLNFLSPIDYQFYFWSLKHMVGLGWISQQKRKLVQSYINPKYDVDRILSELYDKPKSHRVLFSSYDLREKVGLPINYMTF